MGYPSMPEEQATSQPEAPLGDVPSPAHGPTVPAKSAKQSTDVKHEQASRVELDLPRLPPGRAIARITDALDAESSPNRFLSAAEKALMTAVDDYAGRLGTEAIAIARSRNATAVDRQDVQDAKKKLDENPTAEKKRIWILTLAGFTGGGAVAALVTLLLAPKPVVNIAYWWASIAILFVITIVLFVITYPRHFKSVQR